MNNKMEASYSTQKNTFSPSNRERKSKISARYKKGYGNNQSGSGRGLLQKDYFKQKFDRLKQRHEFKKNKREQYKIDHGLEDKKVSVTDDQLKFLPAVATLENEILSDDENSKAHKLERKKRVSKLNKAKQEYKRIQQEKDKIKKEVEDLKKLKQKKYKEKREQALHRNKKLSQKTRKGQPIMRARMDLLFEHIEKTFK